MPRRCKSLSNRMKKVEDLFSTGNICHCIYPVVETRDVDDMEEEDTKDAKHAKDGQESEQQVGPHGQDG